MSFDTMKSGKEVLFIIIHFQLPAFFIGKGKRLKDFVLSRSPVHHGPQVKNVVELGPVRDVCLQLCQRARDPGRLEHSFLDEDIFPRIFEPIEGLEEMAIRVREGDLEMNRALILNDFKVYCLRHTRHLYTQYCDKIYCNI